MNILAIAMIALAVIGSSTTMFAVTNDVFAPTGRRWTPAVDDVITYENRILTSQMNSEYAIDYMQCTVSENTAEQGKFTAVCSAYPEYAEKAVQ